MAITIIVVACLAVGFLAGFATGRLPVATPTFYTHREKLPTATLLVERVRDRRADISRALNGRWS